jgi:hypothetical protein
MKKLFFPLLILLPLAYANAQSTYRIYVNNINLPVDNKGVLADVDIQPEGPGGKLNDIIFLFSGGFMLSGKSGDSLWANAQASASSIEDYQAGNVDSIYYDPRYGIYIVSSYDPPFSQSWLRWKYAVQIGADYYDGNNDGIYDPIDINGNGTWDINEDKPDMLGLLTAWCVYNDGVPKEMRRYTNINPQGIEIRQTIYVFRNFQSPTSPVNNTIIIRYRIINTGKVVDRMDSVYFSAWTDTDIGRYYTDLAGCDTILNAGYVYKDTTDEYFGSNPPAHFIQTLQGPHSFIAGETFIDNNSNGIYDEGIDLPLDTAYSYQGPLLGIRNIPGSKNLNMSSFRHYMKSHPVHGDPGTSIEARNYMQGLLRNGAPIDPCNWIFGGFLGGADCNDANPVYWYSGDPTIPSGWLNKVRNDQRSMTNIGPFKLEKNKAVEIIVAYVAARGNSPLNSVEVTRNYCKAIEQFYHSNFTILPTDIHELSENNVPNDFQLFQNYPNPFNPCTKISWQSPVSGWQTLKVYDVLGNEVATLVNEVKEADYHSIDFDGSALTSGVYFYRIQSGKFIDTKKMVLLR